MQMQPINQTGRGTQQGPTKPVSHHIPPEASRWDQMEKPYNNIPEQLLGLQAQEHSKVNNLDLLSVLIWYLDRQY